MKVKMSFGKEYESKYDWDCFCQGGDSGIVLPKGNFEKVFDSDKPLTELAKGAADKESYVTAFFEAFPNNPKCFIRGEGGTIEDAEENCWQKYQKILNCNHEMERRDRTDGYAYCKHCSYSSTVFEPLTKCCKCKTPTAYTQDYKGNWYCEKHKRFKIKNPNPSYFERSMANNRLPRKRKKLLKKCITKIFREKDIQGKVKFNYIVYKKFTCNGHFMIVMFREQERKLIKEYNG
jgi:hypothetical protein